MYLIKTIFSFFDTSHVMLLHKAGCSPNNRVVAVDDASQGSVIYGEAVPNDDASPAKESHTFFFFLKKTAHSHTK